MPIDDDNIGQFVVYDTDTDEYTALAPLDESPDLESVAENDAESIVRLVRGLTMISIGAVTTAYTCLQFKHAFSMWLFNNALQSGDRRKIKRAKRKYKAAKRELKRRILNDS